MIELKYRRRLSTSVDKGLYEALFNYSYDSGIPMSRLLDRAIEDFLKKNELPYEKKEPYGRKRFN